MRFAMFIDYANLFESIKKVNKIKGNENIEKDICRNIKALSNYVETSHKSNRNKIKLVAKITYVLPNKYYGKPELILPKEGIVVKRVKEERQKKTEHMKKMNASRADDAALKRDAQRMAEEYNLDGIIVVSNDGDFAELSAKMNFVGKDFWSGIFEGDKIRASRKLKNKSDRVLPIHEIASGADEGIPLGMDEIAAAVEQDEVQGARIEIYKDRKFLFAYPLEGKTVSIGRRSLRRYHLPNIDLTDYDKEKIVSRQHGDVHIVGNRVLFSVHQNCTRGTWSGLQPKKPCEQFIMQPYEPVVIGDKNGFVILYAND